MAVCYLWATATGTQLLVARGDAGPVEVPIGAAVFATAAAGAGAYLAALLSHRTSRPRRTFAVLTVSGLLLSAVPPLQAAVDVSTATWLLLMHVVAALALIPIAVVTLPARRTERGDRSSSGGRETATPGDAPGQR